MSLILLSVTESDEQIISGIPEYIEFSSSIASTIFYTFDGTDPNEDSEIAVGNVYLPTTGLTLVVKAFAISGEDESDILELEYVTDQSDLTRTRLIGKEGINILPADSESVEHLSYDVDGEFAQESVIEFVDLDIRSSTSTRIGEQIPNGSTVEFINFAQKIAIEEAPSVSSPNEDNVNFDPRAKLIIINGFTEDDINNQIVKIINRPSDSLPVIGKYNKSTNTLVSGHLVRAMLNPKTNKIVFYYRESRENRWLKSIQETEFATLNLSPTKSKGGASRLVFRWVDDRTMRKIF